MSYPGQLVFTSARRTLAGRHRGMLLTNVSRLDASCALPFTGVFKADAASSVASSAPALPFDVRREAIRDFSGRYGEAREASSEGWRSGRFRLVLAGAMMVARVRCAWCEGGNGEMSRRCQHKAESCRRSGWRKVVCRVSARDRRS